ncbi:MAG: 5-deoxy-glucuronate isomerase, partial [Burkholderiaceae bacterium]|nr:5-deoxy-glucuronate isomerase [Burkholderiaceae bacterium]
MHIAPYENQNRPIVDIDDAHVPLVYFNIVKLKAGETYGYRVPGYETCVVPATGTVTVEAMGETFAAIGNRGVDVWDGEPEGVYVPTDAPARITALTDT